MAQSYSVNTDEITKMLYTNYKGPYHNSALCPQCGECSKPIGINQTRNNKIQLVRACRDVRCNQRFWYWVQTNSLLIIFDPD